MRNWVRIAFLTMLGLNAVVIVLGLYMAFWPMRAISVQGHDEILNPGKTVAAGQVLIYRLHYCKYTNRQAAVTRLLKGPVNYSLPASVNNVPTGCRTAVSRNTIIPDGVQPGTYRLELTASYQLNALRTITVSHNSEPFTITPRGTQSPTDASPVAGGVQLTVPNAPTPLRASPRVTPVPYGTDPVTGEPTQPSPTPRPQGTAQSILGRITKLIGL